jgi:hypothetical protein
VYGLTRGTMTLIGVAAAGTLVWLASLLEAQGNEEYWTQLGLVAAAGLVLALSQVAGGWTKWGLPTVSPTVFLIGFLPTLVAGGLVLLHAQPEAATGSGWASDLGLGWLADDLAGLLPAIALAIGLVLGFVLDTTGPRLDDEVEVVEDRRPELVEDRPLVAAEPRSEALAAERRRELADGEVVPADRDAADEPVGAEREYVDADGRREVVRPERRRGLFRR